MNQTISFPASGHWSGFINQNPPTTRNRLDVMFQFSDGRMTGIGNDEFGIILVDGRYEEESGEFNWIQTHVAGHRIRYRGFREGDKIWGTWKDERGHHGGFLIWPLSRAEMSHRSGQRTGLHPSHPMAQ